MSDQERARRRRELLDERERLRRLRAAVTPMRSRAQRRRVLQRVTRLLVS